MCKINGHSFFSYIFNPVTSWKKKFNSKDKAIINSSNKQAAALEKEVEALNRADSNEIEGEMPVPTVPINTQGTGLNTLPRVGLNL